jgi:hypothetical protein
MDAITIVACWCNRSLGFYAPMYCLGTVTIWHFNGHCCGLLPTVLDRYKSLTMHGDNNDFVPANRPTLCEGAKSPHKWRLDHDAP